MSRNTIRMGRWLAIAADTRLVGCCQVVGLALLCMVLLFFDSAVAGKPAPPSGWKAVTLNTASGIGSHAVDINDAGDVVGDIGTPQGGRPVLWEVNGTTVTEHVFADGDRALGVNELQQVVGQSGVDAAYWASVSSPAAVLATDIEGQVASWAFELNDDGVIVGYAQLPDSEWYPVVWRVVDGVPTIGHLLPGGAGTAQDLTNNDASGVAIIVGEANWRPVTWTVKSEAEGSLTVLSGPDDVDPLAVGYGCASDINALGNGVCGHFQFTESTEGKTAVRAWNGGSLEILGQINERQPDDQNKAISINNAGKAVGYDWYTTAQGGINYTGILWEVDGSAKPLVKLVKGWYSIREARGINNHGVIAANGQLVSGDPWRALVMIPPK